MHVGDLLLAELAPHERVHGSALDGSGTDQGDLHDQVVELARLQAGQQPHLRARLHLEHPDRVGPAQHVVHGLLFFRQGRQLPLLTGGIPDQVEAVLQGREHAEPQQVELHQSHPRGVVFVPLDDRAVFHARVLDGHDLAHRPIGKHHAPGMDAEVSRRLQQLRRELDDLIGDVVVASGLERRPPALDLLRPGILLTGRVSEGPGHVAHGVLGAVLDDVGHLRRPLAPVLPVDPLDDLFSAVGVEIDVDVGFLVAQARQEPLERQLVEDGVDRGDVEQVADRAVGGRSAPLAQDAATAGLGHDAVDDEEIPREVLHLDDAELAFDAAAVVVGEIRVLAGHGLPHQVSQP